MRKGAVGAAVVAVLALAIGVLSAAFTLDAEAAGECAWDARTIQFGTGPVGYDQPMLEGINHYDLPYAACSDGRYNIDSDSDPVLTEQHCAEGFLRVYASPGGINVFVRVNWLPSGQGCA